MFYDWFSTSTQQLPVSVMLSIVSLNNIFVCIAPNASEDPQVTITQTRTMTKQMKVQLDYLLMNTRNM